MKSYLSLVIAVLASLLVSNTALAQTGTVQFSSSSYSVFSEPTNAMIEVSFTGTNSAAASVTFATSNGTALANVNYLSVNTNLEFAPSAITTTVTFFVSIPILGNVPAESNQTVELILSNAVGPVVLGSQPNAVLSIINTNTEVVQPSVEFNPTTYTTYDTNTNTFVNLILTSAPTGTVTVLITNTTIPTISTNVSFTASILSNLVALPLPTVNTNACDAEYSLTLFLTNVTGDATIGSTNQEALLTILPGLPAKIQFSTTNFIALERAGRATVTVNRCGTSSATATVDYATSDGTAKNGVDYLGTSGMLTFTAGVSSASFSFQIIKFSTFQSNKTVNVTLSSASGASLGTQDTAVVTIVNDRPQTITFTNSSGDLITLALRSIGTMQLTNAEPLDLILSETEAATRITMKVKVNRRAPAHALPQIGQVTGNSDCGLIDAGDFDVVGAGIQLDGYLGQLRIHDLTNDAVVVANGGTNRTTTIFAHNLMDGCVISNNNRIGALRAARFGNGASLTAPQIGAISIKGDKKIGLPGDCLGTITISGNGLDVTQPALGSLNVAGAISNSSLAVSTGSVGSVSALQMIDSTIYIGYSPTNSANPISGGGTFVAGLRLGSVNIRSSANGFINSDIAASQIGNARFGSITTDNGTNSFGITAQQISGVSCKAPLFRFDLGGPNDQSLGEFHVLVQ
jgi:hypothetical protein